MNLAYKIAIFCGLVPLVIAVIILSGWLFTGSNQFLFVGIFNILGGLVLFVIGCCCLIFYEYQSRQLHKQSAWKKLLKPFLIMLANFPAAAGSIYFVLFMTSISTVIVNNQTQEMITSIELNIHDKQQKPIIGILPKESKKKHFKFKGGGSVDYSFELNGQIKKGVLIGYASSKSGRRAVMTIAPNGDVSVEEFQSLRL